MSVHSRSMVRPTAQEDELITPTDPFEGFFEASRDRLFTALCLVTGDRHEAEEIAQEAFLRVFERWERVARIEDPESDVFRDRYRRAALALRRSLSLAPRAVDDLAAVEARDEVIRMLRPLPPRQRAAVLATSILDLYMLGIEPLPYSSWRGGRYFCECDG